MDKKLGFTHDNIKNKSIEWYTPEWIFKELGLSFDLDPCHAVIKIPWIPVKHTYNINDDGLRKNWRGNVWLNPPYGKYTKAWLSKLDSHGNGVALVFSRTDCKWFHDICTNANAILFLKGRVKFVDGLGSSGSSGAGCGSMLIAWGEENSLALSRMSHLGFFVKIK